MDQVYEAAFLSINVPGTTDTTHSFLRQKTRPPGDTCTLDARWTARGTCRRVRIGAVPSAQLAFAREEPYSPLERRACATQEYLLSPRILSFGSTLMYFTCNEGVHLQEHGSFDQSTEVHRYGRASAGAETDEECPCEAGPR